MTERDLTFEQLLIFNEEVLKKKPQTYEEMKELYDEVFRK